MARDYHRVLLLFAAGVGLAAPTPAERFADLTRLDQVAGRILDVLGPTADAEMA